MKDILTRTLMLLMKACFSTSDVDYRLMSFTMISFLQAIVVEE